jgi:ATP-dependent RNA helicase RhlE
VVDVVRQYMKAPVRIAIGSASKPCTNVRVQAIEVCRENKHEVLEQLLNNEDGRCLVFARTKRGTERLAKRLSRGGHSAASIHGDRSQSQRTAALHGFQEGRYHVLVATDVASRGIHVEDIAHVINYDLPQIAEDFIHRVGRTGRAGERGLASTLFEGHEASDLRDLEKTLGISIERTSVARGTESRRESGSPAPVVISEPARPSRSSLTALPGEFLQNTR